MLIEASLLKPRPEGVNQLDAKEELDMLYSMLEQPWRTSGQSNADFTKTEKKLVKFEGIGPTDDETGVPIATRTVSTLLGPAVDISVSTAVTETH